jgi:hypothetical protein
VPGYQSITSVAAGLLTNEETLLDFHQKGWIQVVERSSKVFLSASERYRAKYILYLVQTKHLSDEQVELVMSEQRPPFSAAGVDKILKGQTAV